MHVYLRWYDQGQPTGSPQKMESEDAARAAVLARFPTAPFGPKARTAHQPNSFNLGNIDEVLYAYSDIPAPGVQPVAEILFPPP
jgi:hypothetical protein